MNKTQCDRSEFGETEVDHTLKQFINLAKEFHFPIDAIDHLESATCCAVQFNLKTQGS